MFICWDVLHMRDLCILVFGFSKLSGCENTILFFHNSRDIIKHELTSLPSSPMTGSHTGKSKNKHYLSIMAAKILRTSVHLPQYDQHAERIKHKSQLYVCTTEMHKRRDFLLCCNSYFVLKNWQHLILQQL